MAEALTYKILTALVGVIFFLEKMSYWEHKDICQKP